jgi:hypothetical protein
MSSAQQTLPYGRPVPMAGQNSMVAAALQAAQWAATSHNTAAMQTTSTSSTSISTATTGGSVRGSSVSAATPVPPLSLQFPLQFETHGGAYVFQPKSGYFFDGTRDFFYCPKSKLYYGAKNGVYWRFDKERDPPYIIFNPPLPTDKEPEKPENTPVSAATDGADEGKMTISLSLNKGKGKALATASSKRQLKDIAKWGAIQLEEEEEQQKEIEKEKEKMKERAGESCTDGLSTVG